MTSTLIGTAAPTTGELVAHTNPAGEVLTGLVKFTTRDGRLAVQVGGPNVARRDYWRPEDVTLTTPEAAAKAVTVGQTVYTRAAGEWHQATVVEVRRTNITVERTTRAGTTRRFNVPAWAALRMAW